MITHSGRQPETALPPPDLHRLKDESGPAGDACASALHPQDWRSVPLATARAFAGEEAARTSIKATAKKFGCGRATLRNFIFGRTNPSVAVQRRIALQYLASAASLAARALDDLTSGLPAHAQPEARAELLATLAEQYRAAGMQQPPWSLSGEE
ncbi:hypothetical protein [Longimicrobium terrae]|uniref:Uncharacterized protein n=1 Tax=Longimicrobium terrae TaxID=1639882 RepID=A0A841GU84_9BACT|nr:hypothetical protein [Longimicrobium terrae]MBB4635883.1 hypothetical protein [Longimicrobium terrae]MBB6070279.1 hypothetical protein [Longimicrobium terrae]NNC30783.1 hypothetical protein [Longimicrobium terrae]